MVHILSWRAGQKSGLQRKQLFKFYDDAILNGELDKYHWLHLPMKILQVSAAAAKLEKCTKNNSSDQIARSASAANYGQTDTQAKRTAAKEYMCDYCYARYNAVSNAWAMAMLQ